ncbi:hypothetical protein ACIRPQ_14235 [Streptomyces sp. NPDC101213]|uniref:hypothetical protein n=1 Tax=unclassified Streptomyces TaxID=2593676 RepID=UPI0036F6D14E
MVTSLLMSGRPLDGGTVRVPDRYCVNAGTGPGIRAPRESSRAASVLTAVALGAV